MSIIQNQYINIARIHYPNFNQARILDQHVNITKIDDHHINIARIHGQREIFNVLGSPKCCSEAEGTEVYFREVLLLCMGYGKYH